MGLGVISIQPKRENIPGRGHQPFSGHTDLGVKTLFQHQRRKADVQHCVPQAMSTTKFCSKGISDLKCLSGSNHHLSDVLLMMHICPYMH